MSPIRRFHFAIIFFLSILFTNSGRAQSILLTADVSLKKVAPLQQQQVQSDIDLLINTLKEAYGGKYILPANQFDTLIQNLNSLKALKVVWSSELLCAKLAEQTEQVSDYHLTVYSENRICLRQWPEAQVGPNAANKSPNPTWGHINLKNKNNEVDVVAIKKMSPSQSPDWSGLNEVIKSIVDKKRPFILDLRGNSGGDLTKGLEVAQLIMGLNDKNSVPRPAKTTVRKVNAEAWSLMANQFWLQGLDFKSNGQSVPTYLSDKYTELSEQARKKLIQKIPSTEFVSFQNQRESFPEAFTEKIYVLVDRHCGSSCELFLEILELLPNVESVGEPTTGILHFGNVGALYLPESHLVVRIPTQGSFYRDQRQIEKVGYQPDHRVTKGADALKFTLDNLFSGSSKTASPSPSIK